MNLILTRDVVRTDCTLGLLTLNAHHWQTIERPWIPDESCRGGQAQKSCVPLGFYKLVRHDTPKHPKTWALVNHELDVCADPITGKRSDCLIHPANWAFQLEGCIAPGKGRSWDGHEWMMTDSRAAMTELQAALPWTDEHTIEIRGVT